MRFGLSGPSVQIWQSPDLLIRLRRPATRRSRPCRWEARALVRSTRRSGAPERSRTSDLLVRSQTLYPAELRARRECAGSDNRLRHGASDCNWVRGTAKEIRGSHAGAIRLLKNAGREFTPCSRKSWLSFADIARSCPVLSKQEFQACLHDARVAGRRHETKLVRAKYAAGIHELRMIPDVEGLESEFQAL